MNETEAREIIAPYRTRLKEAIRIADKSLQEVFGSERYWLRRRTLSNIRNDLVCREMRRIFATDPDIRFVNRAGRDLMYVSDKAVIVFKKVDGRRRRTHNWPTQLAMQLFGQRELIDLPPTPRFVAGWQLDRLGIAVQDAVLTYPRGRYAEFAISLDDAVATSAILATPRAPDQPSDSTTQVKVKKQLGQGDGEQRAST